MIDCRKDQFLCKWRFVVLAVVSNTPWVIPGDISEYFNTTDLDPCSSGKIVVIWTCGEDVHAVWVFNIEC